MSAHQSFQYLSLQHLPIKLAKIPKKIKKNPVSQKSLPIKFHALLTLNLITKLVFRTLIECTNVLSFFSYNFYLHFPACFAFKSSHLLPRIFFFHFPANASLPFIAFYSHMCWQFKTFVRLKNEVKYPSNEDF